MLLDLGPSSLLLLALSLIALAVKLWALVDALIRPAQAYVSAGKLTKPIWVAILAVSVLLGLRSTFGIFGLLGMIAALVYLLDVRPAVRQLGSGGSPGPWG
jgi:hypothetical protein